jgi:hypothetical protein
MDSCCEPMPSRSSRARSGGGVATGQRCPTPTPYASACRVFTPPRSEPSMARALPRGARPALSLGPGHSSRMDSGAAPHCSPWILLHRPRNPVASNRRHCIVRCCRAATPEPIIGSCVPTSNRPGKPGCLALPCTAPTPLPAAAPGLAPDAGAASPPPSRPSHALRRSGAMLIPCGCPRHPARLYFPTSRNDPSPAAAAQVGCLQSIGLRVSVRSAAAPA